MDEDGKDRSVGEGFFFVCASQSRTKIKGKGRGRRENEETLEEEKEEERKDDADLLTQGEGGQDGTEKQHNFLEVLSSPTSITVWERQRGNETGTRKEQGRRRPEGGKTR